MSSDQLKMYENASKVDKLLQSDLSHEDCVAQIEVIVVCKISAFTTELSKYAQRDSIAIVRRTMAISNPVHVPVILLSAAAEFQSAYGGGGGDRLPRLSCISENDPRAKASIWYEPPPNKKSFRIHGGMQWLLICGDNHILYCVHSSPEYRVATNTQHGTLGLLRRMSEAGTGMPSVITFVVLPLPIQSRELHYCESTIWVEFV